MAESRNNQQNDDKSKFKQFLDKLSDGDSPGYQSDNFIFIAVLIADFLRYFLTPGSTLGFYIFIFVIFLVYLKSDIGGKPIASNFLLGLISFILLPTFFLSGSYFYLIVLLLTLILSSFFLNFKGKLDSSSIFQPLLLGLIVTISLGMLPSFLQANFNTIYLSLSGILDTLVVFPLLSLYVVFGSSSKTKIHGIIEILWFLFLLSTLLHGAITTGNIFGIESGLSVDPEQSLISLENARKNFDPSRWPAMLFFKCIDRLNEYDQCRVDVTERADAEKICSSEGRSGDETCIREKLEGDLVEVSTLDFSLSVSEVEFKIDRVTTFSSSEGIFASFSVNNEENAELTVDFSCKIKKGEEEVPSILDLTRLDIVENSGRVNRNINCKPVNQLSVDSSTYSIEMSATVRGLGAYHELCRIILSPNSEILTGNSRTRLATTARIYSTVCSGKNKNGASSSKNVRLDVGFSDNDKEYIQNVDDILYSLNLVNLGRGKIISTYDLFVFPDQDFSFNSCNFQPLENFDSKISVYNLLRCRVNSINQNYDSSVLIADTPIDIKTSIKYDYMFEQKLAGLRLR